jgi:hypothetical protein
MHIENITVQQRKQRGWSRREVREYNKAPRIYIAVKDENVLEHMDRRMARPSKLWASVIPQAMEALGVSNTTHRAAWSIYAGCTMCPCSSGFVIKPRKDVYAPYKHITADCWVVVSGSDAAVDPNKPTRGLLEAVA